MSSSYDEIAEQWHTHGRGQAYVDRVLAYVDMILADLRPDARVLDLGCGTGNPIAKYVVERGFRVVGVDHSIKMLEIAKGVVAEAELVQGDIVTVEFANRFAGIIAWDSVFHVERKYHGAIYRKLANALEPGGRLLLAVGGSDARSDCNDSSGEGFTSEMFGHTFFYSGYDPAVARQMLEAEGFEIYVWEDNDPTSRGHIAVVASKEQTDR